MAEENIDAIAAALPSDTDIVLTRRFNAPRELVFKAWTQPEHLVRWFAPDGCSTPHCTVDLRPGGIFHFCMRMPDGQEIWGIGVYRDIVEPERLVYIDSFADEEGNPVPPSHYGMSSSHPAESLVTVTFTESDGGTTLTLRHALGASVEEGAGAREGWSQMLDRLEVELARV